MKPFVREGKKETKERQKGRERGESGSIWHVDPAAGKAGQQQQHTHISWHFRP